MHHHRGCRTGFSNNFFTLENLLTAVGVRKDCTNTLYIFKPATFRSVLLTTTKMPMRSVDVLATSIFGQSSSSEQFTTSAWRRSADGLLGPRPSAGRRSLHVGTLSECKGERSERSPRLLRVSLCKSHGIAVRLYKTSSQTPGPKRTERRSEAVCGEATGVL
jgi:hypothetical protein